MNYTTNTTCSNSKNSFFFVSPNLLPELWDIDAVKIPIVKPNSLQFSDLNEPSGSQNWDATNPDQVTVEFRINAGNAKLLGFSFEIHANLQVIHIFCFFFVFCFCYNKCVLINVIKIKIKK